MTRLTTRKWGALGVRLGLLCFLVSAVPAVAAEPPSAAASSGWHFSAAPGVGHAYGLLGVQLQVRRDHFAGFLALGHSNVPIAGGGLRWYPSGERGPVFSLHGTHTLELEPIEPLTVFALTLGWRWRWEPGDWRQHGRGVFAEVGVGPAFYFYKGESGRKQGFGALGPDGAGLPDVALALGVEL